MPDESLNAPQFAIAVNAASPTEYHASVLLVGDAAVARVLRDFLAEQGNLEFHHCFDVHSAVQLADQLGPTVIIQDFGASGEGGLAITRQLRQFAAFQEV